MSVAKAIVFSSFSCRQSSVGGGEDLVLVGTRAQPSLSVLEGTIRLGVALSGLGLDVEALV